MRYGRLLLLFSRCSNWDFERLSILLKVTQVTNRTGILCLTSEFDSRLLERENRKLQMKACNFVFWDHCLCVIILSGSWNSNPKWWLQGIKLLFFFSLERVRRKLRRQWVGFWMQEEEEMFKGVQLMHEERIWSHWQGREKVFGKKKRKLAQKQKTQTELTEL